MGENCYIEEDQVLFSTTPEDNHKNRFQTECLEKKILIVQPVIQKIGFPFTQCVQMKAKPYLRYALIWACSGTKQAIGMAFFNS